MQDYEGLPPNIENKSLIVVTLSLYINILCKERNCIAGFRPVNLTRTENVKRRNTGNSQENKRSETGHNMIICLYSLQGLMWNGLTVCMPREKSSQNDQSWYIFFSSCWLFFINTSLTSFSFVWRSRKWEKFNRKY